MDKPVIQLLACKYKDIAKHTIVLNKQSLEYYMYVYIHPDLAYSSVLYDVVEVMEPGKDTTCSCMKNPGMYYRESKCWVRLVSELLNMNPGKHTYRLMFVDPSDDSCYSLYVSYILQDDCPDKPYIYMNRTARETEGGTVC